MTPTRAGSLIFLVAGAYGLVLSLRLPMGRWNEPGAGAFPLIVSFLLTLCGALVFAGERGRRRVGSWRARVRDQARPALIVGLTGAFIALLNPLGYLVAASLYVFALLFWVSRYRLWLALLLGVAIGVASWFVFGRLFQTPLPAGLLDW